MAAFTQQITFTGVATADLATAFPYLETAVGELEAQAAGANTNALYQSLGATVQASVSYTHLTLPTTYSV